MPQCIFCDQPANSREHLWPKWVHERRSFGQIQHKIGGHDLRMVDPELKVKVVCASCNNGWMHRLQDENIPHLGPMAFHGFTFPLDQEQRGKLAHWTTCTAMVADWVRGRNSPDIFYYRTEREIFRKNRRIPSGTNIWIGKYEGPSLGIFGTDLSLLSPAGQSLGAGMAMTIILGNVVAQIVTIHPNFDDDQPHIVEIAPKEGDWDDLLVPIWPLEDRMIEWPPRRVFTRGEGPDCILNLVDRWRLGSNLTEMRYQPRDSQ